MVLPFTYFVQMNMKTRGDWYIDLAKAIRVSGCEICKLQTPLSRTLMGWRTRRF